MNDTQFYVAVAITPAFTLILMALGLIFNNSRMTDLRNDVKDRLDDMKEVLRAEARDGNTELKANIDKLSRKVDEHLTIVLGKLEELERRR